MSIYSIILVIKERVLLSSNIILIFKEYIFYVSFLAEYFIVEWFTHTYTSTHTHTHVVYFDQIWYLIPSLKLIAYSPRIILHFHVLCFILISLSVVYTHLCNDVLPLTRAHVTSPGFYSWIKLILVPPAGIKKQQLLHYEFMIPSTIHAGSLSDLNIFRACSSCHTVLSLHVLQPCCAQKSLTHSTGLLLLIPLILLIMTPEFLEDRVWYKSPICS